MTATASPSTAATMIISELGRPDVGVVLGSGLGAFADQLTDAKRISYSDIPGMPRSSVAGHAGTWVQGRVGDVTVACLSGRAHAYEGHPVQDVVFGVRLLAEVGCNTVFLTNAAGGLGAGFSAGDFMLVTDHLNLTGLNPLAQRQLDGPRFVDMTHAYDPALQAAARRAAARAAVPLKEGIYAGLLGPNYETPAEIRMLSVLGASAVGMSTVLEVIALRQRGVRVGAVSCITNLAAGISPTPLSHDEVQSIAAQRRSAFVALLREWIVESRAQAEAQATATRATPAEKPIPSAQEIQAYLDASSARTRKRLPLVAMAPIADVAPIVDPAPSRSRALPLSVTKDGVSKDGVSKKGEDGK